MVDLGAFAIALSILVTHTCKRFLSLSQCLPPLLAHYHTRSVLPGGNVEQITELRRVGESVFAMAQPNAGAARANGEVPQEDAAAVADGALQLVNGAVLPQIGGARIHGATLAAAPVAGPLGAPLAVALFPQGLAHGHFDLDGALLGPLPTKSNGSCKILPKIPEETGP